MKKLSLKRTLNLRSFALAGIFAVALFTVSCNKADDGYIPEEAFLTEDAGLKKGSSLAPSDQSIAEIAIAAGFDSLVVALSYVDAELNAGLVNLFLNGKDQYTVFAPTNEAFENLVGSGKISDLPASLVLDVLLYHVTDGRRAANSVVPKVNTRTIETLLDGATFSVDKNKKIWAVGNTAMIVAPNISASNGIIHVIDTVILPIAL